MFGGVERMLITLSQCNSKDFAHEFVLFFDGPLYELLKKNNSNVTLLEGGRLSRPWTLRKSRSSLKNIIHQCDSSCSVYHIIHDLWTYATTLALTSDLRWGERSLWLHTPVSGYFLEKVLSLSPPKKIIANSSYVKKSIALSNYVNGDNVIVVNPPVESPHYIPDDIKSEQRRKWRSRIGLPQDSIVGAYLGRYVEYKGLDRLVLSLCHLKDMNLFIVIGGGAYTTQEKEYCRYIKLLINQHGLEKKIFMLGHVEDVSEVLYGADLYIQPNRRPEPYGISFVEAILHGLPIITSPEGGVSDIIGDASYAGFVLNDNLDTLVNTIRYCANNISQLDNAIVELAQNIKDRSSPEQTSRRLAKLLP